jgi:hypothetical protein
LSIKIYKFESYSVEVVQNLAHSLPQSLQDELVWECTELSRDSFENLDIKEEFVRFCVLNSSIVLFGRNYENRLIGYSSNSIKNVDKYYILYLQSSVIMKKYQGKGLQKVLFSVKMTEEKNRIKKESIDLSCVLLASRTQNPRAFKFLIRNLGLFPYPDGTIDDTIRNIGKKFAESLYDKNHVEYGKQIEFDAQTFVERGAYKSVTQTSVNGVYPSGIPFCHDDDEVNQYMNQHLDWQNGDALIQMGYYDEEKINRMFEEVQQRMGFCGIEEAELDLYYAVSS